MPSVPQPAAVSRTLFGQRWFGIRDVDQLPPFFMSIVSDSDLWLYLSSTGGLTAGRGHADQAIFPYYTDDKLAESTPHTGDRTLLRVQRGPQIRLWEPFAAHDTDGRVTKTLYKSLAGNAVLFEAHNHDLRLRFRYAWRTSHRFGFVRSAWLSNQGTISCTCEILDGLQNILPWGVTSGMQEAFSNLADAYKRAERDPDSGLAVFALSSILTDRAEPSEALRATTVWQAGLDNTRIGLTAGALDAFRQGESIDTDLDVRGGRGAFFVQTHLRLAPGAEREWMLVANTAQDHADVAALRGELVRDRNALRDAVLTDVDRGTRSLLRLVGGADGLQTTREESVDAHHFANTLFNVMRGGVFADGHTIARQDLIDHVTRANRSIAKTQAGFLAALPATLSARDLRARVSAHGDANLDRLCSQFLPLCFSRRHGDPSRPWNRFSILPPGPDGRHALHYEGNWRDIFQNWEALAFAYPQYAEGFLRLFLCATTADGYNPYRLSERGIDWEVPDPQHPWANAGYWSDHQIVYLTKLMEALDHLEPGRLAALLTQAVFSHADVPYAIHDYPALVADPYHTIDYDADRARRIARRVAGVGGDGRLVADSRGHVVHVSLLEKLLILLLAKLANFVPDGGIWMNTQRPEWNDANNALVGKGISVVTVCYLRRFVALLRPLLAAGPGTGFAVTRDVGAWWHATIDALARFENLLDGGLNDETRRAVLDALGTAGGAYRRGLYAHGVPTAHVTLGAADLATALDRVQRYLDCTIRTNQRIDGLYQSYNTLHLAPGTARVAHLNEMLEGQVAVLSSGLLTPPQALLLLRVVRASRLYRDDQRAYILYPNVLPTAFLEKNQVPAESAEALELVMRLTADGDTRLLRRNCEGVYHFCGDFRNAHDVTAALDALAADPRYQALVARERDAVLRLFEATFSHDRFTGRSGSFFAYEGVGSVYWHMVAKLALAAQENAQRARAEGQPAAVTNALVARYRDVQAGLGFNKTPAEYGAFPSDPYSHTPWGKGARQPGMTGQVKEELLSRLGELGVTLDAGRLGFEPWLLTRETFTASPRTFQYVTADGTLQKEELPAGAIGFTFCQTPVVYRLARKPAVRITYADGRVVEHAGTCCDDRATRAILDRDGTVCRVEVSAVRAAQPPASRPTKRARAG
jgi:hypothetical protein